MPGESDLGVLLATLRVEHRPGVFTVVATGADEPAIGGVAAMVREAEGTTVVCTADEARARGWPVDFEAAWLTLAVHSSLDAVGLTAAVAGALADVDIPANVVAGYYHDHLLVPVDRVDDAVACLDALAARHRSPSTW